MKVLTTTQEMARLFAGERRRRRTARRLSNAARRFLGVLTPTTRAVGDKAGEAGPLAIQVVCQIFDWFADRPPEGALKRLRQMAKLANLKTDGNRRVDCLRHIDIRASHFADPVFTRTAPKQLRRDLVHVEPAFRVLTLKEIREALAVWTPSRKTGKKSSELILAEWIVKRRLDGALGFPVAISDDLGEAVTRREERARVTEIRRRLVADSVDSERSPPGGGVT